MEKSDSEKNTSEFSIQTHAYNEYFKAYMKEKITPLH